MNRIYHSASDELATNSGFQEMPGWSTGLLNPELLKRENLIQAIGFLTMNSSLNVGLNPAGNTVYICGS